MASYLDSVDEKIEALYIAYYWRAGEPDGVAYWRSQFDAGRTFAEIAAAFSTQAETKSQHPFLNGTATTNPTDFIESLYQQLLGRGSDAAGFAYWSAQLSAAAGDPFRVGLLIAQFISGANEANGDAATIRNKTEAALYFASELHERNVGGTIDGTKLDHVYRAIARDAVDNDITSAPASIEVNKSEIDAFLLAMLPNARPTIRIISLSDNEEQGNSSSSSSRTAISADGRYVAFHSSASNLGADANDIADVFLRDTVLGTTQLITTGAVTTASASISDDGAVIAFMGATNPTGIRQIYTWSQDTGVTTISRNGSTVGNASSEAPSISGDGRAIGFSSYATNLDTRDTNPFLDAYLYSSQTDQPFLISYGNAPGTSSSLRVALSRDGSAAVFESNAVNLIPGSTIQSGQVYRWDGHGLQLISRSSDGTPGNGGSYLASVSSDGNLIVFESVASNLLGAGNDTNNAGDIFLFDVRSNQTTLISQAAGGGGANGGSAAPVISGDGRFVVFESDATNIDGGGPRLDIFVRDLIRNETHLVSVSATGAVGDYSSNSASISEDGRYITFVSFSSAFVPGDTNATTDVFLVDGLAQGWWW